MPFCFTLIFVLAHLSYFWNDIPQWKCKYVGMLFGKWNCKSCQRYRILLIQWKGCWITTHPNAKPLTNKDLAEVDSWQRRENQQGLWEKALQNGMIWIL